MCLTALPLESEADDGLEHRNRETETGSDAIFAQTVVAYHQVVVVIVQTGAVLHTPHIASSLIGSELHAESILGSVGKASFHILSVEATELSLAPGLIRIVEFKHELAVESIAYTGAPGLRQRVVMSEFMCICLLRFGIGLCVVVYHAGISQKSLLGAVGEAERQTVIATEIKRILRAEVQMIVANFELLLV